MKRTPATMAYILAAVLLLSACSGRIPSSPSAALPSSTSVTSIKLEVRGPDPTLDALITAFEDEHPTYRVEKVRNDDSGPGHWRHLVDKLNEHAYDLVPVENIQGLVEAKVLG